MGQIHTEIKKLRQLNDWTQNDMADILKVSQAYYSKIERGERNPTEDILQKLTRILHLEEDYFSEFNSSEKCNDKENEKGKGVNKAKNKRNNNDLAIIRDHLCLYSTYSTEAIRLLPEELRELNANLSSIMLHSLRISNDIKNSKIRPAVDMENYFDDYFSEELDLPSFDDYIENKKKLLKDLLSYKPAFERIINDLIFFKDVLKRIDLGLSLDAVIKDV